MIIDGYKFTERRESGFNRIQGCVEDALNNKESIKRLAEEIISNVYAFFNSNCFAIDAGIELDMEWMESDFERCIKDFKKATDKNEKTALAEKARQIFSPSNLLDEKKSKYAFLRR